MTYTLPTRRDLPHKAIEPRKLSKKVAAQVAARTGDLWEVKYDGCHVIIVYKDGRAYAFSRQGEPVAGAMDHVIELLEKHIGNRSEFVLFGEAWAENMTHQAINGEFRRGAKDGADRLLELVVWDMVPLADFEAGRCEIPYRTRRWAYTELVYGLMKHYENFEDAPVRTAYQSVHKTSCERAVGAEQEVREFAVDGFMRKDPNGSWVAGAGTGGEVLKDKDVVDVDVRVVGVFEGKGKFSGMVGGLTIIYKGQRQKCGGGKLTDKERQFYWDFPNHIIDKIVQVHGLSESEDGLLREPRFIRLREDKTEGE